MTGTMDAAAMGSSFAMHGALSSAANEFVKEFENPFVKAIFQMLLISMIPKLCQMAIFPFEKMATLSLAILTRIWNGFTMLLSRIYYSVRSQKMQYSYTSTVNQFSDRQPSELYEAVMWWIQSRPKSEREETNELEYFVPRPNASQVSSQTQQGDPTPEDVKKRLLSTVPQNKSSKIKLEDGTFVEYHFAKDEIELPGQKKRNNLENKKINLVRFSEQKDQTEVFNNLFAKILVMYAESKKTSVWQQKTFLNDKAGNWTPLRNTNTRTLSTTVLKEQDMQRLKNYLATFADPQEKAWFKSVGRSQKLTFMLYGKPGCGKTTLEKAISAEFKRDIYYLNLSNISTNEQLINVFEKIPNQNAVVVIEEIDVASPVVLKRELQDAYRAEALERQKAKSANPSLETDHMHPGQQQGDQNGTKLNQEGFLNAFDGHLDNDGRIMIITTNCLEKLDAAITRPGRVDCILQLTECDLFQICELYKLYYGKNVCTEEHLEAIAAIYNELQTKMADNFIAPTPAQMDSILLQYRGDIDRGIIALRQAIENPSDMEIYIPKLDRLGALSAQVSTKSKNNSTWN